MSEKTIRLERSETETKLFWRAWHAKPGTEIEISGETWIVTDRKIIMDQLQSVDMSRKDIKQDNHDDKLCEQGYSKRCDICIHQYPIREPGEGTVDYDCSYY